MDYTLHATQRLTRNWAQQSVGKPSLAHHSPTTRPSLAHHLPITRPSIAHQLPITVFQSPPSRTSQSVWSSAASKFESKDTPQVRLGTSRRAMGANLESRKALRGQEGQQGVCTQGGGSWVGPDWGEREMAGRAVGGRQGRSVGHLSQGNGGKP